MRARLLWNPTLSQKEAQTWSNVANSTIMGFL